MSFFDSGARERRASTVCRGLAAALILCSVASLAFVWPESLTGPIASLTNAPALGLKPAELNCTLCHENGPDLPGGSVEILDLPTIYSAGETYPLRVRLQSSSPVADPTLRWGFQLTAVHSADGEGAGTFVLPHPDTLEVVNGSGAFASRRYVQHKSAGVREGLSGPIEWSFSWQAPDPVVGPIYFYVAGNATNGNLDPSGDFVYTAADTVLDLVSPTRNVTWGAIKARYR